jgi:cell wall-associated NlpC family hydrolase
MSFDSRRMVDKPHINPVRYEVLASHVPLKKTPRLEAGVETEALRGEVFNVYESRDSWLFGQLERDKYVGWIHSFFINFDGSKSMISAHERGRPVALIRTPNDHCRTHKVIVPRTFTYPAASMKLSAMSALSMGSAVQIVEIKGDFSRTSQGEYIWASHLCGLQDVQLDFVSVAEQFLHVPYLWGGKTSLGLDCSGLVQISLQAAGIEAPRDSDMQFNELGVSVELKNVQRGDLVFWRGHVGIMVDSSILLHANGYHMVVVKENFAGAIARIKDKSFGEVIGVKRLE